MTSKCLDSQVILVASRRRASGFESEPAKNWSAEHLKDEHNEHRRTQSISVGLNVYPESPASLTDLGSTIMNLVGSGTLTQALNNAGMQVKAAELADCMNILQIMNVYLQ